jgi:hypothetical protein
MQNIYGAATNSARTSKQYGEQRGWDETRQLTYREIEEMSADEAAFHQQFNPTWARAFELEENRRHNRKHMKFWDVRRMWKGEVTEEEDRKAREAGAEFAVRYPQFQRTMANAQAMVQFMEENELEATKIESYISAFGALLENGTLTAAPVESADEFLRNHPELTATEAVPPIIRAKQAKAQATEDYFLNAPKATTTARAGATSLTDYPQEQRGVPPYTEIEKASFRNLLQNLTADDYQKRLQDREFRAAIDRLGEK